MKIAGIIAEYDPFHTGHAYHIHRTKELANCDYVVVCMSTYFTQRGAPACIAPAERVRAALSCGADAVVELPTLWTVRTADMFARGGTAILGGIGCDLLSFGSESNDPEFLFRLAELRDREPEEISAEIQRSLSEGKSHARATGEAVARYLGVDTESLNLPNLTLGVEYIRSIGKLGLAMEILPILRRGEYHDTELKTFSSASAIRKNRQDPEALKYLPECERKAFSDTEMHPMDDMLLYRLRNMSAEEIALLPDVVEGLEQRVLKAAFECGSREELIEKVKCKRYTYARIARLCTHALLGMDRELAERHPVPEYARLLGVRKQSLPVLKKLKERASIPIISSPVELKNSEIFRLDARAADTRSLLCESNRSGGKIYTDRFVVWPE